jgi:hypothetical protein
MKGFKKVNNFKMFRQLQKNLDDKMKRINESDENLNKETQVSYIKKTINDSYDPTGDVSKEELEPHYGSFQDALEAAKKHALDGGYVHDKGEFEAITNKGYIKNKDKKTHAFHMSLKDKYGNELKKIHSFQITGSGEGKFNLTQDIK